MFSGQYYFLVAAFPPLRLGMRPEISLKEAKDLCLLNLSREDFKKVQKLLQIIDLYNIRAFWLGLPLNENGNFAGKDLEEALLVRDGIPLYLSDFLDRYETTEERLRYFSSLYTSFYREEEISDFLIQYFKLEREMRLILAALRAKKFGRDIIRELQFEDPGDPLVADIFAQKDAPEYFPPADYEDLKAIFVENIGEPRKLEQALIEWQFEKIEELEEPYDFSIDRVLNYLARLLLVESWEASNQETGMAELEQLSQYG